MKPLRLNSEVETSPKDGQNHSASLIKFLLLSRRNKAGSRLGQKFKDELAEPKTPLSTFVTPLITWRNVVSDNVTPQSSRRQFC